MTCTGARQVRARLRERAQETQVEVAFAQQTGRPDLDHDHLVLPRRLAHAHIAGTHPGRLIVHLGVHRSRGGRDDALLRLRRGTRRVLVTATMAVDISAGARAPSPVVRELGSEIPRARERSNWRIKSPWLAARVGEGAVGIETVSRSVTQNDAPSSFSRSGLVRPLSLSRAKEGEARLDALRVHVPVLGADADHQQNQQPARSVAFGSRTVAGRRGAGARVRLRRWRRSARPGGSAGEASARGRRGRRAHLGELRARPGVPRRGRGLGPRALARCCVERPPQGPDGAPWSSMVRARFRDATRARDRHVHP